VCGKLPAKLPEAKEAALKFITKELN